MLKKGDRQYELTGAIATLSIPTTLQDSLMARLDRLATAKAVAQCGSVIGRQFSYELLRKVSPLDEGTLQRELGRLVDAELVYQRGVIPQATYIFKHALVQNVAYESLLRRTRQQYHAQIAHVLASHFDDIVQLQPELLAHHCTEAGLIAQAVTYWHQAGQRARERSAHAEAINHLRQGVALLATLPDIPERVQQELALHVELGPVLMAATGFGSPETEHSYVRALALCQQVEDTPHHFPVLLGLGTIYLAQGKLLASRLLREQLLHLAQEQHDSAWLLQAHLGLGATLFWLGEFVQSRTHFEQAIRLYDPNQARILAFAGDDAGVSGRRLLGGLLWILGYPDQALQWLHEAVRLAQGLNHPFSLAFALHFCASLYQRRREVPLVREHAEALMALSLDQGFPQWVAFGRCLRGWALVGQGQGAEGIAQMHQGYSSQTRGQELGRPVLLAMLAEAYGTVGQAQDGLRAVTDALAAVHNSEEHTYEAELYRLKGELLLQQSSQNPAEAEACFHQALDVASSQQAKSWELRAATSLARFWQSQGKGSEARELLAPVYGWFTEGFDTADLQDAKSLLDELEK